MKWFSKEQKYVLQGFVIDSLSLNRDGKYHKMIAPTPVKLSRAIDEIERYILSINFHPIPKVAPSSKLEMFYTNQKGSSISYKFFKKHPPKNSLVNLTVDSYNLELMGDLFLRFKYLKPIGYPQEGVRSSFDLTFWDRLRKKKH